MSDIKCSVKSCAYNEDGQVCTAPGIEVNNSGKDMKLGTDMEIGSIGGGEQAVTSAETMCRTFRKRG